MELPDNLQRELDGLLDATAEGIGAALGRYGFGEGSVLVQAVVRASDLAGQPADQEQERH